MGPCDLIDAAKQAEVRRFVYTSIPQKEGPPIHSGRYCPEWEPRVLRIDISLALLSIEAVVRDSK
jgi:hypothetical protein